MKLPRFVHRFYERATDPAPLLSLPVAFDVPAILARTAGNEWDQLAQQIVAEVTASPTTFLRRPTVKRCLHPNQQKLGARLLAAMAADRDFMARVVLRATEPAFGNPFAQWGLPRLSPTAVSHLYYLFLAHQRLGLDVLSTASIVELGGGYGGLCRLIHGLGYAGDYTIVDLPPMQAVQRHYLGHTISAELVTFATIEEFAPLPDSAPSALFATFSLSEMPPAARLRVERWLPSFDYVVAAYNPRFGDNDNTAYFSGLADRLCGRFRYVQHFRDKAWDADFLLAH